MSFHNVNIISSRTIFAFMVIADAKPNGSNSLEMLDRMTRFV